MKKSLYNIAEEYLDIANQLEDGEVTPELETALAINETELQGKAIAYAHVIKDSDATCKAIDDEVKRLQALKKSEQNKSKRLKDTISKAMNLYGILEVKTETTKLNFRRSEGVICTDSDVAIPSAFATVVPETTKPNLVAIKKAIKEGEAVTGFEIEERFSLQIK